METNIQCKCGATLKAKQELAGKQVKCPRCSNPLLIPASNSIRVTCPCGQRIQAKSSLQGKRVQCPACKQPLDIPEIAGRPGPAAFASPLDLKSQSPENLFPLPTSAASPFNDVVWDEVARSVQKNPQNQAFEEQYHAPYPLAGRSVSGGQRASWDHVRLGITLNYIGMLLFATGIISLILGIALGSLGSRELTVILGLFAMFLSFCGSLISMIGAILCLTVPKRANATLPISISVGLNLLCLLSTVVSMIPGLPNLRGLVPFVNILGLIFFVLFLRNIATHLRSDELVQRATEVLILTILIFVFGGVGVVVMTMGPVGVLVGVVAWLLVFFMFLLGCFRYFQLLSGLRLSL